MRARARVRSAEAPRPADPGHRSPPPGAAQARGISSSPWQAFPGRGGGLSHQLLAGPGQCDPAPRAMRSRPAISTRRMIGLTDRADGRASFLYAPDAVAPPVALEPDNSPYRSPRSPATKRFQPASNTDTGDSVQVVKDRRVELRAVTVGVTNRGFAEARTGLAAGEIVIARAAAFLRNGDEVRSIEVADAAREAAK